jgi:glycine dehydrogenase
MNTDLFALRHIGTRTSDHEAMLNTIGVSSLDQLISETVPDNIRLQQPLNLEVAMSEQEYLQHIHDLASKNKVFKSYIGLGYHPSNLPAVIQRNILENPVGILPIHLIKLKLLKVV